VRRAGKIDGDPSLVKLERYGQWLVVRELTHLRRVP
jgi:hypothetical protein